MLYPLDPHCDTNPLVTIKVVGGKRQQYAVSQGCAECSAVPEWCHVAGVPWGVGRGQERALAAGGGSAGSVGATTAGLTPDVVAVTLGPLDLVVVDSLETALHAHFGWSRFRAGQRPVVEAVLSGRDALAVLPTGGGKSLCYQLIGFKIVNRFKTLIQKKLMEAIPSA